MSLDAFFLVLNLPFLTDPQLPFSIGLYNEQEEAPFL